MRGDAIRLGAIYVCYDTRDKIPETIIQSNNYIIMNLVWKDKLKEVVTRVNVTKLFFPYDITVTVSD